MTISPTNVRFNDYTMWVELTDGRTLGIPLAWFATAARRSGNAAPSIEPHRPALERDRCRHFDHWIAGRSSDITKSPSEPRKRWMLCTRIAKIGSEYISRGP